MIERHEPAQVFRDVPRPFATRSQAVTALRQLSFEMRAGKISGLIGPDGAGNTTLMRLAAGLLEPDQGSIQVLEFENADRPRAGQACDQLHAATFWAV